MRAMVVGGAGYLGSVLVPVLLGGGYTVRVVDRLYYGDQGLKPVADRCEIVRADMRHVPDHALEDVDVVINLGGLSNDPTANYNPAANWELNFDAVVKLAETCRARGIRRYIFAGSCSTYDRRDRAEDGDVLLTEESPLQPVGYYAEAKYAAEQALVAMTGADFSPVMLRQGTIFGHSGRMRFDLVVNTMVRDALAGGFLTLHAGGETWRPLVEVRDAAQAYLAVLRAPEDQVKGEIFNIVHSNLRISEVGLRVQATLCSMGVPCEIRSDYSRPAARNYRVSGEKARRVLGFAAQTSVEESVAAMVRKFRGYSARQLYDPIHVNIDWMQMLERAGDLLDTGHSIFSSDLGQAPAHR